MPYLLPETMDSEAEADAILAADPVSESTSAQTGEDLRYSLLLVGFDDLALEPAFKDLSLLRAGRRKPVDSTTRLLRRIRDDRDTALKLLQSEGWYGADVQTGVSPPIGGRVRVSLSAVPGERYRFAEPALTGVAPDVAQSLRAFPLAEQGVAQGQPARNAAILLGEQAISRWLLENGYPFSAMGERTVVVDHATTLVTPGWIVEPGPKAVTGQLRFPDEPPRLQRHLARLARFDPGDPYDQRQIEDLRSAIVATGLYSSVQASAEPQPGAPAVADIVIRTEAAKRKTIAVSGGYGTGEGPKVEASWQNRSIFGGEERLTLLGRLGTEEQSARADLIAGNFRRRDQVLLATLAGGHLKTDAYTGNRALVTASIERLTTQFWQKNWTYSAGLLAEYGDFREAARSPLSQRATWTVAAPLTLRFDGTNDLFDPQSGFRVAGSLSPEINLRNNSNAYVRVDVTGSAYWPVGEKLVLATRLRTGSIIDAELFDVPVTRRYFAGGGGSVRGFSYQGVGPVDATGAPTGGRSVTEASIEGRWRVNDLFGAAAFVDMGAVDTSARPKLEDPRFGIGVGVRYYAPFGPVRVDVATPLGRRAGESRIGIYVSIGQSF